MTYLHYAIVENEYNVLCIDDIELASIVSIPMVNILVRIDFTIHGKDYKTRKASLEKLAIDWSSSGDTSGLFYSDLCILSDFFRRNGERYGLLTDFIENGLC